MTAATDRAALANKAKQVGINDTYCPVNICAPAIGNGNVARIIKEVTGVAVSTVNPALALKQSPKFAQLGVNGR